MKTTRIKITNLFGIRDMSLDGQSVELTGPKGAGKTSMLDAIRLALTNKSGRDFIVRQGADAGEILIETDNGLTIDRKVKAGEKSGRVSVKSGTMVQTRPAEFLNSIFTPLQLNPVEFAAMGRQEKNRVILSLVKYDWDMNTIKEWFGEIPNVDYSKHILEVLADIASERGAYYQTRQEINRELKAKSAMVSDIAKDIPPGFDFDRWNRYNVREKYQELSAAQDANAKIERAQVFRDSYDGKRRGIESQYEIACAAVDRQTEAERRNLTESIARMEEQIAATKDKIQSLDNQSLTAKQAARTKMTAALAELDKSTDVAAEWADKPKTDVAALQAEIDTAEEMRGHLNEYQRMTAMQADIEKLSTQSQALTDKLALARELPAKILEEAELPVEGLTVENGVPLIHGMPISNLSDGETLELCVDIAAANPGQLQIILIDGAERLDEKSRAKLYAKCREKGLQMIASRVADTDELEVAVLNDESGAAV